MSRRKQTLNEHVVILMTERPFNGPVWHYALCRTCTFKGEKHLRKAEAALDKVHHIGKNLRRRR